ncbi:MAG: CDF family Co(II)/Ni(II) efflux transporter DmeF [Myxococcota bacterium]
MHEKELEPWQHTHLFGGTEVHTGERRTRWVIALTLTMMVAELYAGFAYNSMALLADGWHMASHAAALLVAAFAYAFARRNAGNPRFSFGTGKVGALGGFASGVGLAIGAILVFVESVERLLSPVEIHFDEALLVAGIGLVVNLVSAALLHDDGHHHHGAEHHHDHNLRGAYLHVLADALTSLFAIGALLAGKYFGLSWMDGATGMLASLVVARWSVGLLRDTGAVLLDAEVSPERRQQVIEAIEAEADNRVCDLHVWRVGPKHFSAIVSIVTHEPRPPEHYKQLLHGFSDLAHVTVEVHRCGEMPRHGSTRVSKNHSVDNVHGAA